MSEFDTRISEIMTQLSSMLDKIAAVDTGLSKVTDEFRRLAETARTVTEAAGAVEKLSTALQGMNSGYVERLNKRISEIGTILNNLDAGKLNTITQSYVQLRNVMEDIHRMQGDIANSIGTATGSFNSIRSAVGDLFRDIGDMDSKLSSIAESMGKFVSQSSDISSLSTSIERFNNAILDMNGAQYREVAASLNILRDSLREFENMKLAVDVSSLVNTAPQIQAYIRDTSEQLRRSLGQINVAPAAPTASIRTETRTGQVQQTTPAEIKREVNNQTQRTTRRIKSEVQSDPEEIARRKAEISVARSTTRLTNKYVEQGMDAAAARERAAAEVAKKVYAAPVVQQQPAPVKTTPAPAPIKSVEPAAKPESYNAKTLAENERMINGMRMLVNELQGQRRFLAEERLKSVPNLPDDVRLDLAQRISRTNETDLLRDPVLKGAISTFGKEMESALRSFRADIVNRETRGSLAIPKRIDEDADVPAGTVQAEIERKRLPLTYDTLKKYVDEGEKLREWFNNRGMEGRAGPDFSLVDVSKTAREKVSEVRTAVTEGSVKIADTIRAQAVAAYDEVITSSRKKGTAAQYLVNVRRGLHSQTDYDFPEIPRSLVKNAEYDSNNRTLRQETQGDHILGANLREAAKNLAALERAVDMSPGGVAVFTGAGSGAGKGTSASSFTAPWEDSKDDHVGLAYRDADGKIKIVDAVGSEDLSGLNKTTNMMWGSVQDGGRWEPNEVAQKYDRISAVPVMAPPQIARKLVEEIDRLTTAGTLYSFKRYKDDGSDNEYIAAQREKLRADNDEWRDDLNTLVEQRDSGEKTFTYADGTPGYDINKRIEDVQRIIQDNDTLITRWNPRDMGEEIGETCASALARGSRNAGLDPNFGKPLAGLNLVQPTEVLNFFERYNEKYLANLPKQLATDNTQLAKVNDEIKSVRGLLESADEIGIPDDSRRELGLRYESLVQQRKDLGSSISAGQKLYANPEIRQAIDELNSPKFKIYSSVRDFVTMFSTKIRDGVSALSEFNLSRWLNDLETRVREYLSSAQASMSAKAAPTPQYSLVDTLDNVQGGLDTLSEKYFRPFSFGISQFGGVFNGLREGLKGIGTGGPGGLIDSMGGIIKMIHSLGQLGNYFNVPGLGNFSKFFNQKRSQTLLDFSEFAVQGLTGYRIPDAGRYNAAHNEGLTVAIQELERFKKQAELTGLQTDKFTEAVERLQRSMRTVDRGPAERAAAEAAGEKVQQDGRIKPSAGRLASADEDKPKKADITTVPPSTAKDMTEDEVAKTLRERSRAVAKGALTDTQYNLSGQFEKLLRKAVVGTEFEKSVSGGFFIADQKTIRKLLKDDPGDDVNIGGASTDVRDKRGRSLGTLNVVTPEVLRTRSAVDTVAHELTHSLTRSLEGTPKAIDSYRGGKPYFVNPELESLMSRQGRDLREGRLNQTALYQGISNPTEMMRSIESLLYSKRSGYVLSAPEAVANIGQATLTGNEDLQRFFKNLYGQDLYSGVVKALEEAAPETFSEKGIAKLRARFAAISEEADALVRGGNEGGSRFSLVNAQQQQSTLGRIGKIFQEEFKSQRPPGSPTFLQDIAKFFDQLPAKFDAASRNFINNREAVGGTLDQIGEEFLRPGNENLRRLFDSARERLGEDFATSVYDVFSDPSDDNIRNIAQRARSVLSPEGAKGIAADYATGFFKEDPSRAIGFLPSILGGKQTLIRDLVEASLPDDFNAEPIVAKKLREELGQPVSDVSIKRMYDAADGLEYIAVKAKTANGAIVQLKGEFDAFGRFNLVKPKEGISALVGEFGHRLRKEIPDEIAESAIYGSIAALQQMFQQIVGIQDELTEVALLFNAVGDAADGVKADFLFKSVAAANKTGQNFEAAMDVSIRNLKVLSAVDDPALREQFANQLTELQLGSMTAFDLTLPESMESVPAIFSQLQNNLGDIEDPAERAKIAIAQLADIFDKMVIAQRESGAEGKDLIQVYAALGSTAKNIGLSSDELLSLTAVAAPALNKSPVETANSLKLLIETTYQAGSDELAGMGIATQVLTKGGQVKTRDFNDVLADIISKIDNEEVDPKKIFEAIGGRARAGEAEAFIRAYATNNQRVTESIGDKFTGNNFDTVVQRRAQDFAGALNQVQGNVGLLFERLVVGTGLLSKLSALFQQVSVYATGLANAIKDNPDAFEKLANVILFLVEVVFAKMASGFNLFSGNIGKIGNYFATARKAALAAAIDFTSSAESGPKAWQRGAAVFAQVMRGMALESEKTANQIVGDSARINKSVGGGGTAGTSNFSLVDDAVDAANSKQKVADAVETGAQKGVTAALDATVAKTSAVAAVTGAAPTERMSWFQRQRQRFSPTNIGRRMLGSIDANDIAEAAQAAADARALPTNTTSFWQRSKVGRGVVAAGDFGGAVALPLALDLLTKGGPLSDKDNIGVANITDNGVNIGVGIATAFAGFLVGGPAGAAIGYTIGSAFSDSIDIPGLIGTSDEEKQRGKDFIRANLNKSPEERKLAAAANEEATAQINTEVLSMFNAQSLTGDFAKVRGLSWSQPITSQVSSADIRQMLANREAGNPLLQGVEIDVENFARYMAGVPTRFEEVFDVLTKPENALALQLVKEKDLTDVASDLPRVIGDLAKDQTLIGERAAQIEDQKYATEMAGATPMLNTAGTVRLAVAEIEKERTRTASYGQAPIYTGVYGEGGPAVMAYDQKYSGVFDDVRSGKLTGDDATNAIDQYNRGRESLVGMSSVQPQISRFAARYNQDLNGLNDILYQMGTEGQQQLIARLQPLFEANEVVQAFESQQRIVAEYEKNPALLKADPALNEEYLAAKDMLNADRQRYALAQQRLEIAAKEKGYVLDQAKSVEKQVATRRLISRGTPASFSAPSMFNVDDYSTEELLAAFQYAQEKQAKLIGVNPGYANEFKQERFMLEADGGFKPVSGVSQNFVSEFLQNKRKRQQLPEVVDLSDLAPDKLNKTVARARELQNMVVTAAPGLADEYKDSNLLLLGKNNNLLQELGLSQEYLRMALDENTESTDQLRGHFNLPAGYKPPTVWDYYASGGKETGDVNYVKPQDQNALELAKMIAEATLNGPQSAGGPDLGALGNTVLGANPFYTGGTPDIWEEMPPLEVPDSMDVNTVRLSLANDIGDKPKETGFYYTSRYANEMDDAEMADKARKSGYYYTTQYTNDEKPVKASEYGGYYTTAYNPASPATQSPVTEATMATLPRYDPKGLMGPSTYEPTKAGGLAELRDGADKAKTGLNNTSSALQTFARVVASTNPLAASLVTTLANMDKLAAVAGKLSSIFGGYKAPTAGAAPGSQNLYIYVNGQQVQVSQQPVTGNGGQTLTGARPPAQRVVAAR